MAEVNLDGVFGNLTGVSKFKLREADTDNNGEVSRLEYDVYMQGKGDDVVDFKSVDINNDGVITESELKTVQQRQELQEILNGYAEKISKDFTGGYASAQQNVVKGLKEFLLDYVKTADKIDASDFKSKLAAKYEELKKENIENVPKQIKNNVLDRLFDIIKTNAMGMGKTEAEAEAVAKALVATLETVADEYLKKFDGDNLEEGLFEKLSNIVFTSEHGKMEEAIATYSAVQSSLGSYSEKEALSILKTAAKSLLMSAVEQGIYVKIAGKLIATEAAVNEVLLMFQDAQALSNAINSAIQSLSNSSKFQEALKTADGQQYLDDSSSIKNLQGSSLKVNPDELDLSGISGYSNNDEVEFKDGNWFLSNSTRAGAAGKCEEEIKDTIDKHLKEQLIAKLKQQLQSYGIPFEKVESIFDNAYNGAIAEACDVCISTKHKTWFTRAKAWYNVRDVIDKFLELYNTKIESAITEMNASDTDFDTVDLNMKGIGKDDNGDDITVETGADSEMSLQKAYEAGVTLRMDNRGADYYKDCAIQMLKNLRNQMLVKAKAMCLANNVEFDESVFNNMYNTQADIAVNDAIKGRGRKVNGWLTAAQLINLNPATTTASLLNTQTDRGWISGFTTYTNVHTAIFSPNYGTGLILGKIFTRNSYCEFNPRDMVNNFTNTFKEKYTNWVEEQKKL